MFRERSSLEAAPPADYPAAELSLRHEIAADGSVLLRRHSGLAERYHDWRLRASLRLTQWDLAPDLAEQIGSRRWLRGAATLVGLVAITLSAWPGLAPLQAAPTMRIDESARDEFRSQMIMPLALGADSGRRMGAGRAVRELARAPERPSIDLVATLAPGDSFARMLRRAGVGEGEAGTIAAMVAGAMPLAQIAPGTKLDITLGRRAAPNQPRPVEALSFRARFELQLAVQRQDNGQLALDPRPIAVDATPLRVRGTVGSGLYRAARAAGAPPSAVQQFLKALGSSINLDADLASTDEFDFILAYRRAATGEVEVGDVQYAAILRDGRAHKQLLRWGSEGRFYDTRGVGEVREGLIAPVAGPVSSGYGMRRHPILGYRRMHSGMDFRARSGTPIYAVTDGRVEFAARNGGHGNHVRLRHAGGLGTGYSHMSRIAVQPGQQVKRGQVIGYVGSTGLSTGPHLHYEMYRGSTPVDPASVRFVTRAELSGAQLAQFRARLAALQRVAPGAALAPLAAQTGPSEAPQREIGRLESRRRVD